ncbi:MAG: ATP-binding protein [bacterium]
MTLTSQQTIVIQFPSNVSAARSEFRPLTESLGFTPEKCDEIALVITELATNLIKHAHGGTLTLTPLDDAGRLGLQIESSDNGPGIADVKQALTDRYSTTGTRGTGLGAVNRLMDELEITSQLGRGTHIVCRKWVQQQIMSNRPCPLAFGVSTRPRRIGTDNGDAFVVKQWGESALVGVIDGLGHGEFAHQAALVARQYTESHYDLPLANIFLGVDRACHSTRGVVMALARFDWGQGRLTFASVGNIEARVFPDAAPYSFAVRRGVIGLNAAPKAVVTEHLWPLENILVLHSDGLRTHWSWKDFPGVADKSAQLLAQELMQKLAKDEDDATVLVVKKVIQ